MNVIGISALYHDSACCIIKEGEIVAAAQEERFTRKKGDRSMPINALKYCLEAADISINQIDYIAYYEDPIKKLSRQLWSGHDMHYEHRDEWNPLNVEKEIRDILGYEGMIEYVNHHMSHAASSYFFSGFEESAIMVVDGVGEWSTTSFGIGSNDEIKMLEEVEFPNSLGLFYATITSFLGFRINSGEYKVMGLAPYGHPEFEDKLWEMIHEKENGQYVLNMEYYDFVNGDKMYSDKLIQLLNHHPREPESDIKLWHMNLAKSLQNVLEKIIVKKAQYLQHITKSKNLCLAGGVALNVVANRKIMECTKFENIFVQPASNDAGSALGAAAVVYIKHSGSMIRRELKHVFWGPQYSYTEEKSYLNAIGLTYDDYRGKTEELIVKVAKMLADGKVVAWYQKRMEFGPRALGNRSILADPRDKEMRLRINRMVKKREEFRPFAPAVLEEKAAEHFALKRPSPFMLSTCQVVSYIDLPAITHVDGSARVQTVNSITNEKFYKLIESFDNLTGCPIVLNTSFNVRGEPIVLSPFDAIKCFVNTDIDVLVLDDFIIERNKNTLAQAKMLLRLYEEKPTASNMYSFI